MNNLNRKRIKTVEDKVLELYPSICPLELRTQRRFRLFSDIISVIWAICRQLYPDGTKGTNLTLQELGEYYNRVNHATVIHGVRKVNTLIENDKEFYEKFKSVL